MDQLLLRRLSFNKEAAGRIWQRILFPFLVSRLGLILVGWFGHYFTGNPSYARYLSQGYFLSPNFLIDVWSRWDAEWYLSIVQNGYTAGSGQSGGFNNMAFFPLYPLLVKAVTWFVPANPQSTSILLGAGILLSTLFFLASLYLLDRMVVEIFQDEKLAQRTLVLLIAFPAGFIFSAFYTESLFFFLTLAVFYTGLRKRWIWGGLLAGLATLTRPQGILILIPLAWMYLEDRSWKIRAVRADFLAFLIAPLSLLGHFYYLYSLTGDPLAFFNAEAAWGRMGDNALGDLFQQLSSVYRYQFRIDFGFFLVFLAAGVYLLVTRRAEIRFPSRAFAIYALVMLVFPVATGSWVSLSRFMMVLFPIFVFLAWLARKREIYLLILVISIALQVMYFIGWTSYYFIT